MKIILVCQIAEQALISEQVLNSKVVPAHFSFIAYEVTSKQVRWDKNSQASMLGF